jgi:hypothetical protein
MDDIAAEEDLTILVLAMAGARPRRNVGRTTLANIATFTNDAISVPNQREGLLF